MENRGQKRAEVVKELPADKRACNSLEFKPSSSNSYVQTKDKSTNSTVQSHEADMETSSTASASSRSEGEGEREYTSCNSNDVDPRYTGFREYHRNRHHGDQSKLKTILSSLSEETGADKQLAALTELCEVLSFCTEDSLTSAYSDAFSPILVNLAKQESNPEIMLLALRAMTHLCDVLPSSSVFLVRDGGISALCGRLMAIEYLDVAEQCLQALEKISREQPLACLQADAIMAVLSFIDFFSTSVQRVALSTVVNICQKLPSECPTLFIKDAAPLLCNLLQYEDRQIVESVSICLIKIVDKIWQSPEMLDELCKHGLINQVINRINLNSHTMLSPPVYCALFGLLMKLAAGSTSAFKTLHELNISNLLKDVLSASDISLGMSSPHLASAHVQVQDVLKLLKELLPCPINRVDAQQVSEKEAFLASNPECLCNFGIHVLPLLIQMVNSGPNLVVCYSCLSIIRNLFSLSSSNVLGQVLNICNTSSFLAGVFTRQDKHVLMTALQIAETCLEKLPDVFLNSFMKEGVCFAINSLLQPEEISNKLFQTSSGSSQFFLDFGPKAATRGVHRCLCFTFDTAQPTASSEAPPCNLEKDAILNLATHIRTNYFPQEICSSGGALTDVLQQLRSFSTELTYLMNVSKNEDSVLSEEKIFSLLSQIVEKITGKEPISTFELIESGILNSLVSYLSFCEKSGVDGQYCNMNVVEKRFERLVNLLWPLSDNHSEDTPLLVLVRKLQSALSSLETFPIVSTHGSKLRNYYVTAPYERTIPYPSLRVHFVKEEGEACLSDYHQDVLVDPLSSLDAIERFLFPKVTRKGSESIEVDTSEKEPDEDQNQDSDNKDMQDASLSHIQPGQADGHVSESQPGEPVTETQPGHAVTETQTNSAEHALAEVAGVSQVISSEVDVKMIDCPVSSDNDDSISKLVLYLNGQQLDGKLTLYQAILEQQLNKEGDMVAGSKFWTQVYTLTFGKAIEHGNSLSVDLAEKPFPSNRSEGIPQLLCLSAGKLASDLKEYSSVFYILILLKSMNLLNKLAYQLASRQSMSSFTEGRIDDLNYLKAVFPSQTESEFVSNKLSEKLEQQLRDPLVVSIGAMPLWCTKLLSSCPFLFSFEGRFKYFRLAAFGQSQAHSAERRSIVGGMSRNKFIVHRDRIMDSAAQMMEIPASKGRGPLEVEFDDEVGTGLGPTLEFFTSISHEFQKPGLFMWRGDHRPFASAGRSSKVSDSDIVPCQLGLFPCPISPALFASDDKESSEVISRFVLLGKLVARALQDRRFLDIHFSKAFYKLIIGQELSIFDILSFDPELGRAMLEFQALVDRRKSMESVQNCVSCFRNMSFEDLCLDFTLPGYPDYVLSSSPDHTLVTATNLEEYVSLVMDATIGTGISRQVKAFKSGFDQAFPVQNLEIFSEEEVERLLCGEQEFWTFFELRDHIKFDHGYTASSLPILNLLEIMLEFDQEQRRAFVQFVTGAPRLPPGGLASLHPKLTIVRKHCSMAADAELPSVMTCANYLKLPPYSSKEKMRERMLYAIKEGQGSFHLS